MEWNTTNLSRYKFTDTANFYIELLFFPAITCDGLDTVNNGSITYGPDVTAPYNFGTNATYSCNMGLFLEGDQVRTCQGDDSSVTGTWTGVTPVCAGT